MNVFEVGGKLTVTPQITFGINQQDFRLRGRARTSRFEAISNTYSLDWTLKNTSQNAASYQIGIDVVQSRTAEARIANGSATYPGPTVTTLRVDRLQPEHLDFGLSISHLNAADRRRAGIFEARIGKTFDLSGRVDWTVQGSLIGQTISGTSNDVGFALKPAFSSTLGYRLANGLRLEGDLNLLPAGTPLASSGLTGLSSFLIYRPIGVARELEQSAFGFGALRLIGSVRF